MAFASFDFPNFMDQKIATLPSMPFINTTNILLFLSIISNFLVIKSLDLKKPIIDPCWSYLILIQIPLDMHRGMQMEPCGTEAVNILLTSLLAYLDTKHMSE